MGNRIVCAGCGKVLAPVGKSRCADCARQRMSWRDAEYRRNRNRVLAEETHCWLCGKYVERGQESVDHVVAVKDGGSNRRRNLRLTHRSCNSARGAIEQSGRKWDPSKRKGK